MMQISYKLLIMNVFEQIVRITLYLHGLRQEGVDEIQASILESTLIVTAHLRELLLIFSNSFDQMRFIMSSFVVKALILWESH
jgi:hypothetical protein